MKNRFDLTEPLLRLYQGRPHRVGRYNVGDVWAIEKGYMTVEKFLNGQENDFYSCFRMWEGRAKHQQVQELLTDYEHETKKEYSHNNWVLVGKSDALKDDHGLEIKTGDKIKTEAKEWHEYQARIYCTLFERPIWYIVQPIVKGESIILKTIGEVQRDDDWFNKRLEVIDKFHEKLKNTQTSS